MSHAHDHANTVPRPALLMAFALVGVVLLLVGAVRLGLAERAAVPAVERARDGVAAIETRRLLFADRADGAVVVRDASSGATLATLKGENDGGGFIRGVMRGMARERHMRGLGASIPFILTGWSNGAISLRDAATGRSVEIGAFGPDNRAAFARFLSGSAHP